MDEKLLIARADDLVRLCDRTGAPRFLGFLSEKEACKVRDHLSKSGKNATFFGGFEGALRTFVCVCPEEIVDPQFPVIPVSFNYRKEDKLSHRDFLGAITALGLARETVGDILVESGRAVAFLEKSAAKFVLSQIDKVGRVGVDVREGFIPPLPEVSAKKEFTGTVASLRLDCVIACLCGISRKDAAELIEKEAVSVNSFVCDKITAKVEKDDIISVRKKGRFQVRSTDGVSKKARTVIVYDQYI